MSGGHRWNGYTHRELYEKINSGPGPAASEASADRWLEVARTLTVISGDVQRALSKSHTRWRGQAAENTRAGLGPLGEWALAARSSAETMRAAAEQQAENIGKARADMPAPVSVPSGEPGPAGGLLSLFSGQVDFEIREALSEAAEERAFEVMANYEISTAGNTGSITPFTRPPDVVVATPEPLRGEAGAHIPSARSAPPSVSRTAPTTNRPQPGNRQPARIPAPQPPATRSAPAPQRSAAASAGTAQKPSASQPPAPAQNGQAAPQAGNGAPRGVAVTPTAANTVGAPAVAHSPVSAPVAPIGGLGPAITGIPHARVAGDMAGTPGRWAVAPAPNYLESTGDMFGESFLVSPPVLGEGPA
ncbi:PPE domain-containing protein [Actinoalloteichus hymeniacidonis]|uniref:PPE family protein n=1 Tax=Actinoalloteichus hymeniacidonis TaxID=340345 RepID=A0AAC9MZL4_9PSEU|nr:PPE domain-containing protein [Actinoalloteichus hymeniacidonis]AOS65533.1 PPE family protein [Actinoalloteichus hymeniacidonis]MBB5906379.1 hypothetical protein [Actinoalloteichus hymeniacidonis]